MCTDLTALALVVDRSGSMSSVADDVRGSVKQFIGDQQKKSSKATLTLAQFDDVYEKVYDFTDLTNVDANKFVNEYCPRGSTALLDAIGRTTLDLKQKIDSMPQAERPKRVVVAVITDGLENASKEFTLDRIKSMIKENETKGWDFMFMGTTFETIKAANNIGFCPGKTAVYASSNVKGCMEMLSSKVSLARSGEAIAYTQADRDNLIKV